MTAMKNLMKGLKSLGSSGKSFLSKFVLKHVLCSVPSHGDSAARICSWIFQISARLFTVSSGTSRQVCAGCGNSTVSRQVASWEMKWDWEKPFRSSAFWLD